MATEARFTTVIERAPVPIYLLDRAGRFVYANNSARRFLGDEQLIGQRAIARVHPDDRRDSSRRCARRIEPSSVSSC